MTTQGQLESERTKLEEQVGGKTICDVLEQNARQFGDKPALSWQEDGGWRHMTWRGYRDRVAEVTIGLRELGVGRGDFVAIMARNRPEHLIADLGAVHAWATPVSVYNTFSPDQIAYIAGNCRAKVAVLENREFMERWEKARPELPDLTYAVLLEDAEEFADRDWVVSWEELLKRGAASLLHDPSVFDESWRQVKPEDPVTLIYTSGTTGPPKGVVITNYNALWTSASMISVLGFEQGAKHVAYLPLAHVAERAATHWVGMWYGAWTHFCPDLQKVFEVVPEVRPESFVGVPRVWEKLQSGIMTKLAEEPNERKRKIGLGAIDAGVRAAGLEIERKPVPLGLRIRRAVFERLVYAKIRHAIGLDKCEYAISGAAPISVDTLRFFSGIGLPVYDIYGLSETTAPAIINRPGVVRMGTAGKPMPGVEIKIEDDGELLIRGGNVTTAGYYREPEKTAEAFDDDGWLHTGDVATVDEDAFVSIVDRKKELIITAGGKNIAPSNLEGLLKLHPLIGHACVVGDRKPYLSALIVLDAEVALPWAAENGIEASTIAELARDERVITEIQTAVDSANERVSRVEQIKRHSILPTEWTPYSDELTPTLKLKRRVIHDKYAAEIAELYKPARS
jgi:long-chain acyl-CoA synthetase